MRNPLNRKPRRSDKTLFTPRQLKAMRYDLRHPQTWCNRAHYFGIKCECGVTATGLDACVRRTRNRLRRLMAKLTRKRSTKRTDFGRRLPHGGATVYLWDSERDFCGSWSREALEDAGWRLR